MIELYSPSNDAELAILKSILDAEEIDYFVRNERFGSMFVGPLIDLYNKKTIFVQDDQHDRAKELLDDFLVDTEEDAGGPDKGHSMFDKIRMAFEVLLFGWIMPGRKRKD
jgi:hypothetical protein